jgi:hypothetical protein
LRFTIRYQVCLKFIHHFCLEFVQPLSLEIET